MSKEIDDLLRQQDDVVVTLFTEEQVMEAIKFGWELSHYFRLKTEDELLKMQIDFIQSLKQSK